MNDIKSIEKMTFEEALSELETIVKKIDSGQENLNDAVSIFERVVNLKIHFEKILLDAELRIEKVIKNEEGQIKLEKVTDL